MAKLRVTRDSHLHIRVTSGLKERIRKAAKKCGESQSSYVVRAVMERLRRES